MRALRQVCSLYHSLKLMCISVSIGVLASGVCQLGVCGCVHAQGGLCVHVCMRERWIPIFLNFQRSSGQEEQPVLNFTSLWKERNITVKWSCTSGTPVAQFEGPSCNHEVVDSSNIARPKNNMRSHQYHVGDSERNKMLFREGLFQQRMLKEIKPRTDVSQSGDMDPLNWMGNFIWK